MGDNIVVQHPAGGPDVTRRNRRGFIYFKGDEFTDGSVRGAVHPEASDHAESDELHFEERQDGVWNLTSIEISGESLHIDKDMKLEAAADFLKTVNPSGIAPHGTALIPHTPFITTDPGSGTRFAHTPVAGPLIVEDFVTDPVSQVISTTIGQIYNINIPQIISTLTFKTGTLAASNPIIFTIFKGSDNTGVAITSKHLPTSLFPANSDVVIDLGSSIGFSDLHPTIFIEFRSPNNNFSLETDSVGAVVMSALAQELQVRDVVYDDLAIGADLSLIFANDLSLVYRNQFPQISPHP